MHWEIKNFENFEEKFSSSDQQAELWRSRQLIFNFPVRFFPYLKIRIYFVTLNWEYKMNIYYVTSS